MTLPAVSVMRRLIHGFAWTMFGSVAARGGAFVGMVLAGRALGRDDYGRLGAVQTTVGMFGVIAGFGLGLTATTWISRLRASDPVRAGRLAGALTWAGATTGAALGLVLAMTSWWMAPTAFNDPALAVPLAVGAALVPLSVVFGIQSGVMSGCEAFARLARVNLFAGVVAVPAAGVGAWYAGVTGAAVALVVAQALTCWWASRAVSATLAHAGLASDGRSWWREWRLLVGFSLPAALAPSLVMPVNWLTTSWIARSAGFAENGLYTAGNQWRMLILFVPLQCVATSLPTLAAAHGRGDRQTFMRTCGLASAIAAIVSVTVAAAVTLAPGPMMALFGKDFSSGAVALVVLAWSAVPMAANNVLGAALNGAGKPWRSVIATGIYAVSALGSLAFIPATALGLAWAQLAASALATVVYGVLVAGLRFPAQISGQDGLP